MQSDTETWDKCNDTNVPIDWAGNMNKNNNRLRSPLKDADAKSF